MWWPQRFLRHQEEGPAWVGSEWTTFLSEWLLEARSQLGVQATGTGWRGKVLAPLSLPDQSQPYEAVQNCDGTIIIVITL